MHEKTTFAALSSNLRIENSETCISNYFIISENNLLTEIILLHVGAGGSHNQSSHIQNAQLLDAPLYLFLDQAYIKNPITDIHIIWYF